VKIGGEWANVDPTNNETNSGVPYLLYNASDATASSLDYDFNDEYWLDAEIAQFAATNGTKDYYIVNGLEVSTADEFGRKVADQLKKGKEVISIRMGAAIEQREWQEATVKAFREAAPDKLDIAAIGELGTYIVIDTSSRH
jgi:hypothetical protein